MTKASPFRIGVRLEFDTRTGFLWRSGTADWSDDSPFRIEPRRRASDAGPT